MDRMPFRPAQAAHPRSGCVPWLRGQWRCWCPQLASRRDWRQEAQRPWLQLTQEACSPADPSVSLLSLGMAGSCPPVDTLGGPAPWGGFPHGCPIVHFQSTLTSSVLSSPVRAPQSCVWWSSSLTVSFIRAGPPLPCALESRAPHMCSVNR